MAVSAVSLLAASCGSGSEAASESQAELVPSVVVTTSIWADVVDNLACTGGIDILTVIPPGGDPHGFEPSLADRGRMEAAALVVANGLLLEEGLEDTLDAVADGGTPVFRIGDHIDTITYGADLDTADHDDEHDGEHDGEHDDDDHDDEHHDDEHDGDHDAADDDEDHEDEHDHDHAAGGADPHVWIDPVRVAAVLPQLGEQLVEHAGLSATDVAGCVADYQQQLADLDASIEAMLDAVPDEHRKLVSNHDSLGYFADRYRFDVIGTVIPAPSGLAETNPAQLEQLATVIEQYGVRAVFAESQQSSDDADALATRVDGVEVVTLFTGTLGDAGSGADTYIGLLRTNAQLIADGLD